MKRRHKAYLKFNLITIGFIVVSFTSVTLAWFAYSGLSDVSTEVNVKAWYIELEQDGEAVSNDITISLSDIYPGMNPVTEEIIIKNQGDSDATVNYVIDSARILDDPSDEYIVDDITVTSDYVEDQISHKYPFSINMNVAKNYVLKEGNQTIFKVAISWPLDSGNDALDSTWGTNAYLFQESEIALNTADPEYEIRPSIKIELKVIAEQYLGDSASSDPSYNLGDTILFDVVNDTTCSVISATCLETFVIDENNTLGDTTVTLLPNPNTSYQTTNYNDYATNKTTLTSTWTTTTRDLTIEDLAQLASRDILESVLVSSGISNLIIGNLDYTGRMATEIADIISKSGYYKITNTTFPYLNADSCYWTNSNYDTTNAFAAVKIDATNTKIYPETKTTTCNLVPVLIVDKSDL